MDLQPGANAALPPGPAVLEVAWDDGAGLDVAALLLGPDGRVRGDADMVFFNNPQAEGGAVRFAAGAREARIDVDPAALPGGVARVVVVASVDVEAPAGTTFAAVRGMRATTTAGAERFGFAVPPLDRGETAAVLAEVYRRGDGWKIRAVGQGYASGLAGVAADFGVDVAEPEVPDPQTPDRGAVTAPPAAAPPAAAQAPVSFAPPQPAAASAPAFAPAPAPTFAPPPTEPAPGFALPPAAPAPAFASPPAAPAFAPSPAMPAPASASPSAKPPLEAVSLAKGGSATISLDKQAPGTVVTAMLEWDGGSEERRTSGADLDLYALFVPADRAAPGNRRDIGRNRSEDPLSEAAERQAAEAEEDPRAGAVYWNNHGSAQASPFILLDGDARTPGRETIRIARPDRQGFVLVCAYSALDNGAGSFRSYGARAVVADGAGSTVQVPLYEENDHSYWVAIALIDFTDPQGVAIRQIEAYGMGHCESRPVLFGDGSFAMDCGPLEFKDFDDD